MKVLKLLFVVFGVLGLLASVFNIYTEKTLSGNLIGLISSVFLLIIGTRKKLIEKYINAFDLLTSKK